MTIEHYLLSLRLTDQVSWRAMWLGMIHFRADADKAVHYAHQRAVR